MVRRNGQYGDFLGCSRYHMCKSTKKIGWVNDKVKQARKKTKRDQKNLFAKKFMEDFDRAYK